jgi:hypothetical protein
MPCAGKPAGGFAAEMPERISDPIDRNAPWSSAVVALV